jgi:hypothetical protein
LINIKFAADVLDFWDSDYFLTKEVQTVFGSSDHKRDEIEKDWRSDKSVELHPRLIPTSVSGFSASFFAVKIS